MDFHVPSIAILIVYPVESFVEAKKMKEAASLRGLAQKATWKMEYCVHLDVQ